MNGPTRLVIYHTSDIHARHGFGARLAQLVEPGAMLVDSGDALAGSSVFYRRNEPVTEELAKAPYCAFAVGNREFHYVHRLFASRARKLPAPLVCSNVIDLRRRSPLFARELVVTAAGVPVRFLSLLVPQYRTRSGWEKIFGWRFLSPDAALAQILPDEHGSATTILLSHLGLMADRQLAARWQRLGAILGGHSHDALARPEVINGTPIAHPGAHAEYVGRLELSLDRGKTELASYELLPLMAKTP